jgi:flagellar basal body P-ring protein FlgI
MRTSPIIGFGSSVSGRSRAWAAFALFIVLSFSAAAGDKNRKDSDDSDRKEPKTIGDIASVAGLSTYPVEGVGLIVGLSDTGSDPAQGPDRNWLVLDMQKRGLTNVEEILRSPTTALVKVRAKIPPAVRSCKTAGCWCKDTSTKKSDADLLRPHKGDTFDVEVEVPSRDTTTSLKGGWLLETWLFETVGELSGHVYGKASGPVLVGGGLDGSSESPADLKRGRVLGGGTAKEDRSFALVIDSDRTARWTIQIANRINDRFPTRTRDGKSIAEPKNGQRVHLRVPPRYRQNMARYLEILRYMPLSQDASQEAERIAWYSEDLTDPAKARLAALRLEGIGKHAAESLKQGLTSSDPDVRFFAAEALAYLDDPKSADVLAQVAREIPEYRAHALTALSSLDEPIAPLKLHELTDGTNSVELRYGAFRALRAVDPDDTVISGEIVGDELFLHQVASAGTPCIHLSSRDRPEIVLFGRELQMQTPLLLKAGNNITLQASAGSNKVQLSRFTRGEPVRHLTATLQVRDVVRKAVMLGASYPDIVAMLVQADKQYNLPGRLELDAVPDPNQFVVRLHKISNSNSKAADNVSMPNLFRWTETRSASASSDEDADETGEPEKERKYVSKPGFFDRLFRRTAN